MDEENCPLIKVTKEEIRESFKPWKKALVVKLVGKNLGPRIIMDQAKYLWHVRGKLASMDTVMANCCSIY